MATVDEVDPGLALVAAVLAALYGGGVRRLAHRRRRWPLVRTVAFTGGAATLVLAASGLLCDDTTSMPAHALEHALVGMVAPLLLALGAPVTLALQAVGRTTQVAILRLVHARPLVLLGHPVLAWLAFGGTTVALYTTPLLEATLRSDLLHAAVHVHVLVVGTLFCWMAVGLDPQRWPLPAGARMAAVLLALPFHAVVGLALVSSASLLVPDAYGDLGSQHAAGAVLWAAGELFGLATAGIVLGQWMRADEREARRLDAHAPVTPAVHR
ncbi:cytochrome c oxidase assembly protein [soil metagenome]